MLYTVGALWGLLCRGGGDRGHYDDLWVLCLMSVCRARSLSLFGIDALPVEVEVDVSSGLPGFSIVGLPDAAVQEARERVRVAISNSGYKFPTKKVIVKGDSEPCSGEPQEGGTCLRPSDRARDPRRLRRAAGGGIGGRRRGWGIVAGWRVAGCEGGTFDG